MSGNGAPGHAYTKPLVVSVASGKGGVGKTRISLGLGCEFSHRFKTLLVDLDFFNRGLTGVLPKGTHVRWVKGPEFINNDGSPEQWQLVRADTDILKNDRLHYLKYPDLTEEQTMAFVSSSIETLEASLSTMFEALAREHGIEVIVLDCHGGPDNTSFAATSLADVSILVTDTDKASLHGTFNFIRQQEYSRGTPPSNTHIVFNRIPVETNFNVLERLHDQYFMPKLGGQNRLLAAFAADEKIRQASDKVALFPLMLPNSLWVRKIKTMIFDMLAGSGHHRLLDKMGFKRIPIVHEFRRRSLSNVPWFLIPEKVLKPVAVFAVILMFAFVISGFGETLPDNGDPISEFTNGVSDLVLSEANMAITAGLFAWLLSAMWVSGTLNVKERITAALLRGKKTRAVFSLLQVFAIWFFPALATAGTYQFLMEDGASLDIAFPAIVAFSYLVYLMKALYEAFRAVYERIPLLSRVVTLIAVSLYVAYPFLIYTFIDSQGL